MTYKKFWTITGLITLAVMAFIAICALGNTSTFFEALSAIIVVGACLTVAIGVIVLFVVMACADDSE